MNTENIRHVPALPSFSISVSHDAIPSPSTRDMAGLIVLEENIRLLIGMHLYSLEVGDVLLVPPFTHIGIAEHKTTLRACRLLFPWELLYELSSTILFRAADGGTVFVFSEDKRTLLKEVLDRITNNDIPPARILPSVLTILENDALPEETVSRLIQLPQVLRQALKYINVYEDTMNWL